MFIIKLNLKTLIVLFMIILILHPEASKKTLIKIVNKNNMLEKVILIDIFIINKTFSPIYNT